MTGSEIISTSRQDVAAGWLLPATASILSVSRFVPNGIVHAKVFPLDTP